MMNQLFTTEAGDKAAIGLSFACALHCLMVPLFLAIFPSSTLSGLGDERIHLGLLALIIPISAFSLTLGCRMHRNLTVVAVGVTGICILCLSALLAHDMGGKSLETAGTLLGSGIVGLSHALNFKSCRAANAC
ncbi:MAG: hypothetical protein CME55_07390 [Halieaceae bacterium]|nr:hypothetical protein [Halieaceae bacterium]|tara:strand:- start:369 stop:767 length:399 start_codon:yes stop_codon:yes gene_type:complete